MEAREVRLRGQTYMVVAALVWSSAGVLQRELSVGVGTQVATRAVFAALALLVFVAFSEGRGTVRAFTSMGRAELAVAVLGAVSSGTFITALNYTGVANVVFMQALAPIAAALIAWMFLHESISRRTAVAMVVALAGTALMVGGPGGIRGLGLALSVVMTLSFALLVVITRHRREISMAPAICVSQVLLVAVAAPFSDPGGIGAHDLALLAALGVGQIGLGLVFFSLGARLLPAAEVALISLLESVLAPLWVWLVIHERPATTTLVGGVIVIAAVGYQARADPAD
jgi:drug/metabolite transporter (DMT)-like permease